MVTSVVRSVQSVSVCRVCAKIHGGTITYDNFSSNVIFSPSRYSRTRLPNVLRYCVACDTGGSTHVSIRLTYSSHIAGMDSRLKV